MSAVGYFDFTLPAKVEFGPGRIRILPEELLRNDFNRAAFVVTPGRKRSGMLNAPIAALKEKDIEVATCDAVVENPDVESIRDCVRFLKGFKPDVIIGVGGGSPLDATKAAGICYANGVEDMRELIQEKRMKRRSPPTIMVPTTAGTGTEVNYWAVITDKETKEKLSIGDPLMSPHMALVDPQLTLTLPPKLTLWSGIDALTHAVESYISLWGNWLSDTFCLGAVSLIVRSLEQAVEDGQNLQARGNMALASLLAGAAMENVGLGLVHAMSHQVSGFYGTPHGLANAILLPHVLKFNGPQCRTKLKTLDSLVKGRKSLGRWVEKVCKKYSLSGKQIEIKGTDIPTMAERAENNVNIRTNPRKAEVWDIRALYEKSFKVAQVETV